MSQRIATTSVRLLAVALTLVALMTATLRPAEAAGEPPQLTVSSTGAWSLRPWGDALVRGPGTFATRAGRPQEVMVAGVISPFDRTLPGPGDCEGAFGWVSTFEGQPITEAWLIGAGEVCGVHPQPGISTVTHIYTGDFEAWEAHRPFLGTRGSMEIRLAEDGTGSAFAITH